MTNDMQTVTLTREMWADIVVSLDAADHPAAPEIAHQVFGVPGKGSIQK